MDVAYAAKQYVGIDLHRRRSVIVQTGQDGQRLSATRIDNDPFTLAMQIAGWGEAPQVVLEANEVMDYLRRPGPFEPHRLALEDLEYTTMSELEHRLAEHWQSIREPALIHSGQSRAS